VTGPPRPAGVAADQDGLAEQLDGQTLAGQGLIVAGISAGGRRAAVVNGDIPEPPRRPPETWERPLSDILVGDIVDDGVQQAGMCPQDQVLERHPGVSVQVHGKNELVGQRPDDRVQVRVVAQVERAGEDR